MPPHSQAATGLGTLSRTDLQRCSSLASALPSQPTSRCLGAAAQRRAGRESSNTRTEARSWKSMSPSGHQQPAGAGAAASVAALDEVIGMGPAWARLCSAIESAAARQPVLLPLPDPRAEHRIMALTDIHTDRPENMQWVRDLAGRQQFSNDILILCGDVADTMPLLAETLQILSSTFAHVFFTPGNHDIWLRGPEKERYSDSVEKMIAIVELCESLGVHMAASQVCETWVAPLWSWHHSSFDTEPDICSSTARRLTTFIKDYTACKWPEDMPNHRAGPGSLTTAVLFDELNDIATMERLMEHRQKEQMVLSFSHFLPLLQLLPEKRFLFLPTLAKAAGSNPLADTVRSVKPDIHCFGHTHFSWDQTIGGIRYIQPPLCYPTERVRRPKSVSFGGITTDSIATADWLPLELLAVSPRCEDYSPMGNDEGGADTVPATGGSSSSSTQSGCRVLPQLSSPWSDYYRDNDRQPDNLEPAPWVAQRRARSFARVGAAGGRD